MEETNGQTEGKGTEGDGGGMEVRETGGDLDGESKHLTKTKK